MRLVSSKSWEGEKGLSACILGFSSSTLCLQLCFCLSSRLSVSDSPYHFLSQLVAGFKLSMSLRVTFIFLPQFWDDKSTPHPPCLGSTSYGAFITIGIHSHVVMQSFLPTNYLHLPIFIFHPSCRSLFTSTVSIVSPS